MHTETQYNISYTLETSGEHPDHHGNEENQYWYQHKCQNICSEIACRKKEQEQLLRYSCFAVSGGYDKYMISSKRI